MLALPFPMWPSLMSTRMRDDFGSRRGGSPGENARQAKHLPSHFPLWPDRRRDIGLDGTAQQSCSTQCAEGQRAWLH